MNLGKIRLLGNFYIFLSFLANMLKYRCVNIDKCINIYKIHEHREHLEPV